MKLKELCSYLDSAVPCHSRRVMTIRDFRLGCRTMEITSALVTLDVTEDVIDEAIAGKYDIVVSHHPLIFSGIKKITGRTAAERIIYKCIKHDIAVYSCPYKS